MCKINDVKLIVNEVYKSYKEIYGEKLDKVYLYGSYARGDYTEGSDIDIAALVKADRQEVQCELRKIWEKSHDLGLEYEVIISPTAIPLNEFIAYKSILPYYRNIEKEGILLGESA